MTNRLFENLLVTLAATTAAVVEAESHVRTAEAANQNAADTLEDAVLDHWIEHRELPKVAGLEEALYWGPRRVDGVLTEEARAR